MNRLYKRYRSLLAKGGWMDSWTYKKLREKQASDKQFIHDLPVILEKHYADHSHEEFTEKLKALLTGRAQIFLQDAEKEFIRRFAAQKGINLNA
jgi:hypothetical protein